MTRKLLLSLLVAPAVFFLAGWQIVRPAGATDAGTDSYAGSNVGDVVYSVLPPELFSKAHAGTWVLMDGAPLDASTQLHGFLTEQGRIDLLQRGGAVRVPDGRGVFIRGMNLGRDAASGDPAGTRQVGSDQADSLKAHTHKFSYQHQQTNDPQRKGRDASNAAQKHTETATSVTEPTGEQETRPRNVALYAYIKVS